MTIILALESPFILLYNIIVGIILRTTTTEETNMGQYTKEQLQTILEALQYQTEVNAEVLEPKDLERFKSVQSITEGLLKD